MKPLTTILFFAAICNLCSCADTEASFENSSSGTTTETIVESSKENQDTHVEVTKLPMRKYSTISEMVEDLGDYSADNNTFKVVSEKPLHIRISKMAMPGMQTEELQKMSMSAIIYNAYQAFASTDIEEIKITAVPINFDPESSKLKGFNTSARYTVDINKEKARQVMQKIVGVSNFEDLLGVDGENGQYFENSPNKLFDKLKSEDTAEEVLRELAK